MAHDNGSCSISIVCSSIAWLLFWSTVFSTATFAGTVPKSVGGLQTLNLQSISFRQLAILDGGEWASIRNLRNYETAPSSDYGYMNIAVGKDESDQLVMGIQVPSQSNQIYKASVVRIPPKGVSTSEAISTFIAGFMAVHAVLPQVEGVGGSNDTLATGGKVVVLGGNDLACFAAQGLTSLDVDVFLVSTGNPKPKILSRAGGKRRLHEKFLPYLLSALLDRKSVV